MPSIRFANVLLETKPRALSYPTMYYHTDQLITPSGENGEWTINGAGTVDFTTYFNALSVLKLQKYTRATGFALHIDVKSAGRGHAHADLRRASVDESGDCQRQFPDCRRRQ